MKRMTRKTALFASVLVLAMACVAQGGIVWDVLNVEYGNGAGQVAATGGGTEAMDWYYPSTNTPTETLSDGKTTLTPNGTNYGGYRYTNTLFTMPTDDSWSIEFSMATPARDTLHIYMGDGNQTLNPQWLVSINSLSNATAANCISNYNGDRSINLAPAGFDSALMNSYVFAHDSSGLKLYVNGILAGDIGGGSAGGAADGFPFMFALGQTVEVASVRISESTFVPEPASISLIATGLIAVAFKRRKK